MGFEFEQSASPQPFQICTEKKKSSVYNQKGSTMLGLSEGSSEISLHTSPLAPKVEISKFEPEKKVQQKPFDVQEFCFGNNKNYVKQSIEHL